MERREINTNNILGMDLRDFNVDQQHVKEIQNLCKDQSGWRTRQSKLDVLTGLTAGQTVNEIIYLGTVNNVQQVIIHIDNSLYLYSITNDTVGTLLAKWDFKFSFKIFKHNYLNTYIMIDTTNHINYKLTFNDKVLCIINDTGNYNGTTGLLDYSSEFLMNEFIPETGDTTWASTARHNPYNSATPVTGVGSITVTGYTSVTGITNTYNLSVGYTFIDSAGHSALITAIVSSSAITLAINTSVVTGTGAWTFKPALNGKVYESSIDKYCINYDTNSDGTASEWSEIALLSELNPSTRQQRYILVCGLGADTHVYLYDWDLTYPSMWTTHLKLTGKNVFLVDGIGSVNKNAKYMDILQKSDVIAYNTDWELFGDALQSSCNVIKVGNDFYTGKSSVTGGVYKLTNGIGTWELFGGTYSTYAAGLVEVQITSVYSDGTSLYVTSFTPGGVLKLTNMTGNYTSMGTHSGATLGAITYYTEKISGDWYMCMASSPGGVYKLNSGTNVWELFGGTELSHKEVYHILLDGTDWYVRTRAGVYKKNSGTGAWEIFGSGDVSLILGIGKRNIVKLGSNFYVGNGNGVYKLVNGTWTLWGNGLHESCLSLLVVGSDLYDATASGVYKLSAGVGTWYVFGNNYGSDILSVSLYHDGITFYSSTQSRGIKKLEFKNEFDMTTNKFIVYIPNDNDIASLDYNVTTPSILTYTPNKISSVGTSALSIKSIDVVYDTSNVLQYLVCCIDGKIKIFLERVIGTGKESGTVGTFLLSSETLAINSYNPFIYNVYFNGMCLLNNRYYDIDISPSSVVTGNTLFVAYSDNTQTLFDDIEITYGNGTANMQRVSIGSSIPSSNINYLSTGNYVIFCESIANIFDGGITRYIYVCKDKKIIRFPITGNKMTADDVSKIDSFYNFDISIYSDLNGIIEYGICSSVKGYDLELMDQSKPLPMRPYFFADLYASGVDTLYGTNTSIPAYSEMFNMYQLVNSKNQRYRTSVPIGSGNYLYQRSDTYSSDHNYFKYWIFALLSAGFYDDTAPFINVAKGFTVNGEYQLLYWAQDKSYAGQVYPDVKDTISLYNMPNGFSNVDTNDNSLDENNNPKPLQGQFIPGSGLLQFNDGLGYQFRIFKANVLTGTIAVSNSATLTGTSTKFKTETAVGNYIYYAGASIGKVTAISSNTSLTLDTTYSGTLTAVTIYNTDTTIDTTAMSNLKVGYQIQDSAGNINTIIKTDTYNQATLVPSTDSGTALVNGTWGYRDPSNGIYVVNDKIFYKQIQSDYGLDINQKLLKQNESRDGFTSEYFYTKTLTDHFEIQDMSVFNTDLLLMADYDNKIIYYAQGFKYINKLNKIGLLSKPVAVQTIQDGKAVVICEEGIYILSGTGESNIQVTNLQFVLGIEKDNYYSVVSNGYDVFFQNKKYIYMIRSGYSQTNTSNVNVSIVGNYIGSTNVINISEPINDYLYHQTSDNVLGIDTVKNRLFVPLDATKILALTNISLLNDYGNSASTINYNKYFGVFQYDDLSWKIYSYQDDLSSYANALGNIGHNTIARVGSKLVVPEYLDANGTENPLCRFVLKKSTFSNKGDLKKLDHILISFVNNKNLDWLLYGVDYLKLYIVFDNHYIWKTIGKKYGDFRSAVSLYTDANKEYVIPSSTQYGFENMLKIPIDLDIHDVTVYVEFSRLKDTSKSFTSIEKIAMDVINKGSEINGIR